MFKCFDCGSTIEHHHTASCELAEADDVRDLPSVPHTQHWTQAPRDTRIIPAVHHPKPKKRAVHA